MHFLWPKCLLFLGAILGGGKHQGILGVFAVKSCARCACGANAPPVIIFVVQFDLAGSVWCGVLRSNGCPSVFALPSNPSGSVCVAPPKDVLERRTAIGGAPPQTPPPRRPKLPWWGTTKFTIGKSCRAIFGTQPFGSQTPLSSLLIYPLAQTRHAFSPKLTLSWRELHAPCTHCAPFLYAEFRGHCFWHLLPRTIEEPPGSSSNIPEPATNYQPSSWCVPKNPPTSYHKKPRFVAQCTKKPPGEKVPETFQVGTIWGVVRGFVRTFGGGGFGTICGGFRYN